VAALEMDGGAAVRARAISASRSAIRYCSSGAMREYGVLASAAGRGRAAHSTAPNAKIANVIVLTIFRFIDFSFDTDPIHLRDLTLIEPLWVGFLISPQLAGVNPLSRSS
jgi:hypothetical protein